MARIKQLRQRKADLLAEAETLTAKEDDGSITEDEATRLNAISDDGGDLDTVNASIKREERLMDERRSMDAVTDLNVDTPTEAADKLSAQVKKEAGKFKNFGEFLQSVANAGMNDDTVGATDRRLVWGAATGAGEAVPSDGGFLVQTDQSNVLLNLMHDTGDLMSRVRRIPISGPSNGLNLPTIDQTSRADGSRWGGIRAYWADEADSVTATKPKFRMMELKLKKLMGVGYATDELLADAVALESVMTQGFTEELTFKAEDAIVNGTGSGQLLGILNGGATISVSKESGQAGATIVKANILNMRTRMPIRSRRNAVWLINQDIEPQLHGLEIGGAGSGLMLYRLPGQQGNNSEFDSLTGWPVLPVEYCATLGTVGDIILCDLSQYLMIDKGGVEQSASMHVRFLNAEQTFRWIVRLDGQPAWSTALTPKNGTVTVSPFVSLATRA